MLLICFLGICIHLLNFGLWLKTWKMAAVCLKFRVPWIYAKDSGFYFENNCCILISYNYSPLERKCFFLLNLEQVQRVTLSGHGNILAGGIESCWLARPQSHAYSWTNHLEQESINQSKGGLPIFVNKVLLEHEHIHSFSVACGCYNPKIAEPSSCNRGRMAHKVWNIYFLALYRKNLPTPGVY